MASLYRAAPPFSCRPLHLGRSWLEVGRLAPPLFLLNGSFSSAKPPTAQRATVADGSPKSTSSIWRGGGRKGKSAPWRREACPAVSDPPLWPCRSGRPLGRPGAASRATGENAHACTPPRRRRRGAAASVHLGAVLASLYRAAPPLSCRQLHLGRAQLEVGRLAPSPYLLNGSLSIAKPLTARKGDGC